MGACHWQAWPHDSQSGIAGRRAHAVDEDQLQFVPPAWRASMGGATSTESKRDGAQPQHTEGDGMHRARGLLDLPVEVIEHILQFIEGR